MNFGNLYHNLTTSTIRDRLVPSPYSSLCPFAPDPFFHSGSQVRTSLLSHCLALPFLEFHINVIIWHVIFYVWLWLSWLRIHLQCGRPGFNPWVGKIPWRRKRLPTPVFWPGEFHGLYSPWVANSRTWLSNFHFHFLSHSIIFVKFNHVFTYMNVALLFTFE